MNMCRKKAIIYLIIASILWSIGGVFIKLIDWNPFAIAGARSGIAAIVMFCYLRKPIKGVGKFKLLGALSYTSLLILFVTANKLTTSANAILLQFTAPIWVALFSALFLKEKTKKSDWITILFVILGMIMFFIGDIKLGSLSGNLLSVLSGVAMAGVVIFLKLQDEGSPIEMTLLGNIFTFIIGLPFFFTSLPNLKSVLCLLILGIFQLGISYIFYVTAVKHISALEAILIPILEPLLNPIWVFFITGEAPGSYAICSGFIVVTAIIIKEIYEHRKQVNENSNFDKAI